MVEVDYKKPALIGGLITGLLPVIPVVNICFCLWAVVGGIVAARMLINRSSWPLTSSDGARIGLYAGLIGAALYFIIQAPLLIWSLGDTIEMLTRLPFLSEEMRNSYEKLRQSPVLMFALAMFSVSMAALFLLGLAVVGGLLGVALFEKRGTQPPYPPPPPPPSTPLNYPPPPSGPGATPGSGESV
ncbi:MAG TPA: hypothetical protein VJ302_33105 [Blastocatellia bacterium]|nr:hypothetical protein [Blastocatellia bacterium]